MEEHKPFIEPFTNQKRFIRNILICVSKSLMGWLSKWWQYFKSLIYEKAANVFELHVLWCVWFLQDSFQTLKKWVKELKEHGPEDIVVAIAGNKNDLGDIRLIKHLFLSLRMYYILWSFFPKLSSCSCLDFHVLSILSCNHLTCSWHEIKTDPIDTLNVDDS